MGPVIHAAAINVMREVIDLIEAAALGMTLDTVVKLEVDVVDRVALGITVDQVER